MMQNEFVDQLVVLLQGLLIPCKAHSTRADLHT